MRDWTRGQALGYYIIQPSQFSTRLPLHINDEDFSVQQSHLQMGASRSLNVPVLSSQRSRIQYTRSRLPVLCANRLNFVTYCCSRPVRPQVE